MTVRIEERDFRRGVDAVIARVEAGETFVVTRNGREIAMLRPHDAPPRITLGEARRLFSDLPPIDPGQWRRERAADDEIFGSDDIDS